MGSYKKEWFVKIFSPSNINIILRLDKSDILMPYILQFKLIMRMRKFYCITFSNMEGLCTFLGNNYLKSGILFCLHNTGTTQQAQPKSSPTKQIPFKNLKFSKF